MLPPVFATVALPAAKLSRSTTTSSARPTHAKRWGFAIRPRPRARRARTGTCATGTRPVVPLAFALRGLHSMRMMARLARPTRVRPTSGVAHANLDLGTPCATGNGCAPQGACSAGVCVAGAPLPTDDANDCTTDACSAGVMSHVLKTAGTACRVASASPTTDGDMQRGRRMHS